MGRIVIPRYQRQRAQLKQRPKGSGYFANGFGPQEMSLISKLTDLAVAGGGQIARAVQIGNREEEQAEAQAEYDQGIQTDIENRQRAAQAEVDEAQMASGPQAFAASFFADQPGAAPVSVKEQLIRDASAFRGATQTRGAPIVAAGGMAPEDARQPTAQELLGIDGLSMLNARAQRPAPEDTRPPLAGILPDDLAQRTRLPGLRAAYQNALGRGDVNTMGRIAREMGGLPSLGSAYPVSTGRYMPPETMPGFIEPPGAPTAAMTREDVLRAAQGGGGTEWHEGNTLYDEALARASQAAGPMPPDGDSVYYTAAGDPTSTPHYGPMPMQLTRPAGFEEARQAAQQRDFRQEAIEAAGPAPERKLFRIADILAAAPSARTEEQRAMLLQAAVDSPDIQAANLTDWAKGAYRDRAMQAVMKLFPEEEEALSEYELLRMQSMRESIETSDLRQQTLQAALDEDAAKAEKRANAVRRTDPRLAKKEALFAFYTANWPRKESGEMTEADWAAGAGELTKMTPSGLGAWTRNNRLSRATRKSVNATAGRLLQMRPKPDPQPKVAKPPIASGLRKDLVQSKAEFREIVDELNALDADDPGRDALQLELIRANRRRRDIEDQLGIISPKAVSGSGSSPEDPIRL